VRVNGRRSNRRFAGAHLEVVLGEAGERLRAVVEDQLEELLGTVSVRPIRRRVGRSGAPRLSARRPEGRRCHEGVGELVTGIPGQGFELSRDAVKESRPRCYRCPRERVHRGLVREAPAEDCVVGEGDEVATS